MLSINALKSNLLRTISVADDLSELTTCDAAGEVAPEKAGMTRKGVDAIWQCVADLYRTGIYPGISLCLRRQGHVVINRAIGHSHGNGPPGNDMDPPDGEKVLMTPDTPACQYSASKAVTAMMIHLLAESGEIALTDPVMRYIPEFALHGKQRISILNVISHHGGFPSPPAGTDPEILFDHEGFVDMICGLRPASGDGSSMAYHAVTGGTILGEIVQRVTGASIREFLEKKVKQPLGFRYFNYGVEDEDIDRVATDYATGLPLFFPLSAIAKRALSVTWDDVVRIANQPRFLKIIVPAANLVATADEMSQFYQMLLNGGELNGTRIFKPETVHQAVSPAAGMWFDGTLVIPMRYSAGLMLGASPVGIWGPYSESAYGHIGFINIFCWADPAREISVSLQTTGKSLIGSHVGPLVRFLFTVGRQCGIKDQPLGDVGAFASFKAPFQKMLRKMILGN